MFYICIILFPVVPESNFKLPGFVFYKVFPLLFIIRTSQATAFPFPAKTGARGVKGYYTDLEESLADNQTIISRYHDLYKIEQAFRVSKHDLQTRPIFHFKEEPIRLHLLVCFMALEVSKHIELTTEMSIRAFLTQCKKITDARLVNKVTKKEIRLRAPIPDKLRKIVSEIIEPH